ncbi:uncharacterized protein BJ171DRAFT_507594 [Polychytrium aggregatum]|uniref:uncharacterized protein n=1 Tax=Polychytrium aggregatum TaxID=110093 RepID=UPI0022FEC7EF|nr:uncharacterized protein BJ171DRAFT_507594 [Polychytrium aggregatum]KAI9204084.1 hypothetical protein BJ171DRAFT_507594 [Polychytrium aggregatum]
MVYSFLSNPAEFLVAFLVFVIGVPVLSLSFLIVKFLVLSRLNPKKLEKAVSGRHILLTGASKGLGRSVALILAKHGAHLTLVARGNDRNEDGKSSLDLIVEECRRLAPAHVEPAHIAGIPTDLMSLSSTVQMVRAAIQARGPFYWVLGCAGGSVPSFFADSVPSDPTKLARFEREIQSNYLTAANVVGAVIHNSKHGGLAGNLDEGVEGRDLCVGIPIQDAQTLPKRFVFVGSMLSILSFAGYSSYSASKYALKGLVDGLRNEFIPFGTNVQLFIPNNIDTPGYAEEMKTKPELTKTIEGVAGLLSPEHCAEVMLALILHDRPLIASDLLGEILRIYAQSMCVRPSPVTEGLALPLLNVIQIFWNFFAEQDCAKYGRKILGKQQ